MLSMVNPLDDVSVPLIYENLVRVMALHDVPVEKARSRLADVYITPPVEKYNVLDFASYDPIIEIGYRSALDAFAAAGLPPRQPAEKTVAPGPLGQLESTLADLDELIRSPDKIGVRRSDG
jgi:predicted acylesterase/phospholipase RssA